MQLSGFLGNVSGIRVSVYHYPKNLFILSEEHGAGRTLDVALANLLAGRSQTSFVSLWAVYRGRRRLSYPLSE